MVKNMAELKIDPTKWWTTSDIAAYLGVQTGTVSSYRQRGQMPEPDLAVGRTHVWQAARIIKWHESRPRPGIGGRPTTEKGSPVKNMWRVILTDSETASGVAPVCPSDSHDPMVVEDCCPQPHLELYSVDHAQLTAQLLTVFGAKLCP